MPVYRTGTVAAEYGVIIEANCAEQHNNDLQSGLHMIILICRYELFVNGQPMKSIIDGPTNEGGGERERERNYCLLSACGRVNSYSQQQPAATVSNLNLM